MTTRMLIASLLIAAPAVGGSLTIETVAPADSAAVLSITGLDRVLERIQSSGVLDAMGMETFDEELKAQIEDLPSPLSDGLGAMFKSSEPTEVLGSMSIGAAMWMDEADEAMPEMIFAGWLNMGAQAETIGPLYDQQWEDVRASTQVESESVLGRSIDVVAFGDEVDESSPRIWHVREDQWVLLASDQAGMERLLDVLDGRQNGESLGESEAWVSMRDMLGSGGAVRLGIFVDGCARAMQSTDSGMMVEMIRPSVDAALGKIAATGLQLDVGQGDQLLTWSGAVWMPEGLGGLLELFSRNTPAGDASQWAGPGSVGLMRFNMDFAGIPSWLRDVVASNPMLMGAGQMLDQMEPELKKLLDPLGDQIVLTETVTHPITAESLTSLAVVECANPTALSDALSSMAPEAAMEPREFQGNQIWSVDISSAMPFPMSGMGSDEMAISVAGQSLLVGSDRSVEAAMRSLGGNRGEPTPWVQRVVNWIGQRQVAAWGGSDLSETLTTVAKIQGMQMDQWESDLAQSDPELWEEIKGELEAETNSEQYDRLAKLAKRLGPAGWYATSSDLGFEIHGVVLKAAE
jgi:hypothetical protein